MKKINIFSMVNRWCFPDSTGGVAMHNYYLSQLLQSEFDCSLVSTDSKKNLIKYNNTSIKYLGITHPVLININFSTLKNAVRSYSDYKISKNYSGKINDEYGIVEFMDIHSEGYYYLKKYPNKRKNVVIRSHTPFGLLKQYFNKTELKGVDTWFAFEREKKCFNWAGSITTPSKDLKKRICDMYNINYDKVQVIPNLLDTNHFSPKDMEDNQDFTILHVGRFERAKGVETLIKSFITLSKKFNNLKLINVGTPRGPSFNKCMDLLKKNKLDQKVIFTGFVDYPDLPEFYAKADIVIVPSEIYESFSYTVAQGMACGKPVIASKIGGIPETMNHGDAGFLFEPGNVDQLSDNIETLYRDEQLRKRLGEKARVFINNYSSLDSLTPKYMDFYKSILN